MPDGAFLVLGAAYNQVPLIKKAKELGLKTIAADPLSLLVRVCPVPGVGDLVAGNHVAECTPGKTFSPG